MEKKIIVYSTGNELIKNLFPILKREEVLVRHVVGEAELMKQLDYEEVHLALVELRTGQREMLSDLELLSKIRKKSCVPVIVISDEESECTKIMALNTGADDYILSSCSPLEILARIKAQLRRYTQLANIRSNFGKIYQFGELIIDDSCKKVMVNGRSVSLTPIEYKILKLLVQEQGKVISISQIYETIWHMEAVGVDNTIAVHICHIREKIESNPKKPQYLKAVWGSGYKVG